MAIVEFDNVSFTYDGQRNALDGVTLHIEEGSFTCVLGGNGSGKSTLSKHVNALLAPDEGRVVVCGADTADTASLYFIRSNAGLVFQNPDDQIVASVIEDDVAFGPENLGVPTDELQSRVSRALEQVGLQGFEKKETAALSGGQKQRVAIAGALAMQPRILVFDEASAMLDPRGRAGLIRLCRELNEQGLTIIAITHFMGEASHADRVVAMEDGHIVLDGAPADVLTQAERLKTLHLDMPFAAHMSMKMRAAGLDIAPCVSTRQLAEELRAKAPGRLEEIAGKLRAAAWKKAKATEGAGGTSAVGGEDVGMAPTAEDEGTHRTLAANGENSGQAPTTEGESADRTPTTKSASASRISTPANDGAPVLEFDNVSFTYQPAKKGKRRRNAVTTAADPADWGNDPSAYWAVRNVSFALERGEFLGIAGHTGSGKSTLMQLANGLLQPTEGKVTANGRDLSDKHAAVEARRDIGVVFQYPEHQLFAATVFDDVAFGPRNLGLPAEEVERRVRDSLKLVHLDLDELRETSPFALSGGQQRRVAVAGVLAMNPTTLILDEPIAGLDPEGRQSFLQLITELHDRQGMTIALVSHDMNDLARLCDRVLVLNRGEVFALDEPERVFADEERLRSIGLGVPDAVHLANLLTSAQPGGGKNPPCSPGGESEGLPFPSEDRSGDLPFPPGDRSGDLPFPPIEQGGGASLPPTEQDANAPLPPAERKGDAPLSQAE